MDDFWPGMEFDVEALERVRRSCELLGCEDGMIVLDIGCYRQVARKFLPPCEYHGFDGCKLAEDTIVRDLEGGFLWDEPADRILCLEVLEHLKTPSRTLACIHYYLKDDGIAVISLPNENTLFHRIRALFGTCDAECFGERGKHLHLPSLKQCRRFLEQYFEIVEERYYVASGYTRMLFARALIKVIPKTLLDILSKSIPSLFARGFIFKLRKKILS